MNGIESLVVRGDLSGLSPAERTQFYVQMCERLGLNPLAQPFAILRLNGKEVLYATRGATDQLAALHKVNREIIDGPKVIDLAGTKLVYAVCRATLPNGRTETATATVPLVDPVNVLMRCETKAKRRATLSILGLGVLDETELETIPEARSAPQVPVALSAPTPSQTPSQTPQVPVALPDDRAKTLDLLESARCLNSRENAPLLWLAAAPELDTQWRDRVWSELVIRVRELSPDLPDANEWFRTAVIAAAREQGIEPVVTRDGEILVCEREVRDRTQKIRTVAHLNSAVRRYGRFAIARRPLLERIREIHRCDASSAQRRFDELLDSQSGS